MTSVFEREDILFQVVVNHQEQYSIWPDVRVCRSNRGSHWVQPCLNISFARCSICS